jgi:hypothetical protein
MIYFTIYSEKKYMTPDLLEMELSLVTPSKYVYMYIPNCSI